MAAEKDTAAVLEGNDVALWDTYRSKSVPARGREDFYSSVTSILALTRTATQVLRL